MSSEWLTLWQHRHDLMRPEHLQLFSAMLMFALGMAYTDKQRAWFARRSQGKSELPLYSEKLGWHLMGYCDEPETCPHMEVNHIQNQGDQGADTPENGIRIPKCVHVGVCPSCRIKEEFALKGTHGQKRGV